MSDKHVWDVAVVGAGPAGSATALALRRAGIESVALLHRPPRSRLRVGESAAPDTRVLLARLGLDANLEARGHLPYLGTLSLWGSDTPVGEDYDLMGRGRGYHLDRARFDDDLRAAATEGGAALIEVGALLAIGREQTFWKLAFRDRKTGRAFGVAARYLVDATGRRAAVSRHLGANRQYLDSQVALVVRRPLKEPSRLALYSAVEAVPDGWWYAGGVPGATAVIAFMTDPEIARARGFVQSNQLSAQLAQTRLIAPELATEMDHMRAVADGARRPAVHVARTEYSDRVAGPGWVAVGDAAIGLDPLTSSGISCALGDGIAAGEAIAGDIAGDTGALRGYSARIDRAVGAYLVQWRAIYRREGRWPQAEYWRRRHGVPG